MQTVGILVGIVAVVITGMTAVGFFMRANQARRDGEPDARKYVLYGVLFTIPTLLLVLAASIAPGIIMMQHRHH